VNAIGLPGTTAMALIVGSLQDVRSLQSGGLDVSGRRRVRERWMVSSRTGLRARR
jgi:hypothetical protein